MSKLAVADSFFLEGGTSALIQAIGGYQDWLTFFPTHPLADRVVLKIAESEMRQIGLPDRDATHAKRAETRLKALLQQYPDSILKKDAEERLKQVQDNLGLHNLLIANYYYTLAVDQKKGGLKGCPVPLLEILDSPNFSFMDEALFKLAVPICRGRDRSGRPIFPEDRQRLSEQRLRRKAKEHSINRGKHPGGESQRTNVMPPEDVSFFQNFKNQFLEYPMTIDKDGVLISKISKKRSSS